MTPRPPSKFLAPAGPLDELTSSYQFQLPPELVAQRPVPGRDSSRLMLLDASGGEPEHRAFKELPGLLPADCLLIVNRSKVFPCRLLGKRPSGGAAEVFLLSPFPDDNGLFPALVKCSAAKTPGLLIELPGGQSAVVREVTDGGDFLVELSVPEQAMPAYLARYALLPLPPYIRDGLADERDHSDYQTTFAQELGSVAAPTAGLHFTPSVLSALAARGIQVEGLTLHVGLGTFRPVKAERLGDHGMHSETYSLPGQTHAAYARARREGRPVFAVGTTTLRALESSLGPDGELAAGADEWRSTDIFLRPGVPVRAVDGLLTNFHLPGSTLLMLVSALLGRERVLAAYELAVLQRYRFFSYGDAMLVRA